MLSTQASYWDRLQEPYRRGHISSGFSLLLAAIDAGWLISEPVRRLRQSLTQAPTAYYFSLLNPQTDQHHQLVILEDPQLHQFIYDEELQVLNLANVA